jgi:hypothetical protein
MLYKILADITVLVHFLWVLFLIFGAVPGMRYRAVRIFHLSGLAFAFVLNVFGWYCPLTHLEVWLRQKHDPATAYAGSFVIHYVEKLLYVELTRKTFLVLTVVLCVVNGLLYVRAMRK